MSSIWHLQSLIRNCGRYTLLVDALGFVFTLIYNFLGKIVVTLLQDLEIWETIGLWHYPIPGFYLLAQFGLGVLVAMGNLVNNSVFLYLSDGNGQSLNEDDCVEGEESHGLNKCTTTKISLFIV
jgi:hypothetical protein